MAELVVAPLISLLREKASSYLLDQYKVMEGMEEQRQTLELYLPAIQGVIEDAEKGASSSRPGVVVWLRALRKVSYDAVDVFDEFKYEALRRDAKKKGHGKKLCVDVASVLPTRNPIVFRYRMGKKLRGIVRTMETLVKGMNEFGFRQQQPAPSTLWRQTFPMIDESEKDIIVRSRDEEKKKILKILVDGDADRGLMVLPIVGMGGLGKTTFAKLIFNDPETEKHFELRRWCCVTEDFDIVKIARDICQTNERGPQVAMQDLQKEVSGKRYLIVLDDVWNRDVAKWGDLKTYLQCGGKGSAILTTTRNQEVAQIMADGMVKVYNLEKLGNEFIKEIVQSRALGFGKMNIDELDGMLSEIAKKCHGSPLAAKAFGSLFSNKTSKQEWKDALTESNICNERTGIQPILKLSYDDLPPHMKQCFAFCGMFPKGYEFDVEMLIRLWIAHDFIPPQGESTLEKTGDDIFTELLWRSFFQDVEQVQRIDFGERVQLRYRTICKMHDLMHDIAQLAMGKECVAIVNGSDHKKLSLFTRHVFTSFSSSGTLLYDFLSKNFSTLRTLLYSDSRYARDLREDFSKYFPSIRALQLSQWWREVPIKTKYLQHVRYLNLSNNCRLREFPEGISMLYNLQTLDLSGCEHLERLPEDMKYMTSLRHLYTSGCNLLKCMPPDLRQLTSLQTLTYFVVGAGSSCSSISELQNLSLCGELDLNGLENVTAEHAKAARLENKEKITHLSLQWNTNVLEEPTPDYHRKVLDGLKPHYGLQMLRISNYKSTSLPTWVTDPSMLKHLTELQLIGCTQCKEFPGFWHFTALKFLHLEKLNNLQILCGDMDTLPFSILRELKLFYLDKLERWLATDRGEQELSFPMLERMEIIQCPNLTTLPVAPKLKNLMLDEDKAGLSLPLFKSGYMSSLSQLTLSVRSRGAKLQLDQSHKVSISEMVLKGYDLFFASSPATVGIWGCFARLVDLEIEGCNSLVYWPDVEFLSLVSLKRLSIRYCPKLIGPAQAKRMPSKGKDLYLPQLERLHVYMCKSLTELFIFPSSLKDIEIYHCPSIEIIWRNTDTETENPILVEVEQADDPASRGGKKLSPSRRNHPASCLKSLHIHGCRNLVMLPDVPSSLEVLEISYADNLRSVTGQLDALKHMKFSNCSMLESSGFLVDLPSLESLHLYNCKRLSSLPGGTGNYSTLRELKIEYCLALNMNRLYKCLHRYSNLEVKDLARAHSSNPFEGCPKYKNGGIVSYTRMMNSLENNNTLLIFPSPAEKLCIFFPSPP